MRKVYLNTEIELNLPDYNHFIDLLSKGKQFNFTRVQHGEWDSLIDTYPNFNELIEDIENQNWLKLSQRASKSKLYRNWHILNEDSINRIANMYKVIYENNSLVPNMMLAVSTGVGFGTTFGDYDIENPIQKKRIILLKSFTKNSKELYHAGIIRHMGVMNEGYEFFKKVNDLGINVVLFGPKYLECLQKEFNIQQFNHIEIPYKNAINNLDTLIDKVKEISNDKTLILCSAGHPISTNLTLELKDTNISSLDIGRGFDWNLKKYSKDWPEIRGPWLEQPIQNLKQHINKLRYG